MKFRLADISDLPKLKAFFQAVVKSMYENGIYIWGDYYPYEVLADDIQLKRLYILQENEDIVGVFALCSEEGQKNYVHWQNLKAKAFYIYRLAVQPDYLGKSIATMMIDYCLKLTEKLNAEYLRLLVVDNNLPAMKLYQKLNFTMVDGKYSQTMYDGTILEEFGFEKQI